jgi:arylformamidase
MDLQAEYDNLAKVPEHPAIIAGWERDAAAFRETHGNAEFGLAYGPSPRQALDIFWPGSGRDAPLAIFVHGGYWQRLDRGLFSHLAAGLTAHGVAVALPSYDLCPAVSVAAIVREVRAAAAFLHARHRRRMLAIGHSAGGHLAAMLLATPWPRVAPGLPENLIAAALPISGLFDLPPLVETTINNALGLDVAEAARLSPARLPAPGRALHAVVGGEEGVEYTRQSRLIAESWGGSWEAVPGANHFTVIAPLADPHSALVARALAMLPD